MGAWSYSTILTLIISAVTAAFVTGMRLGKIERDVTFIKTSLKEIRSLFELRLKD